MVSKIDFKVRNFPTFIITQYDKGVVYNFTVIDRIGDFMSLDNYDIFIYYEMPTKTIKEKAIINNNMIQLILNDTVTRITGEVKVGVRFINSETKEDFSKIACKLIIEKAIGR